MDAAPCTADAMGYAPIALETVTMQHPSGDTVQ